MKRLLVFYCRSRLAGEIILGRKDPTVGCKRTIPPSQNWGYPDTFHALFLSGDAKFCHFLLIFFQIFSVKILVFFS